MKKRIKFNYYINLWLSQKEISVKKSTLSRYIEIVNIYIRPYFNDLYIYKINDEIVYKYTLDLLDKNLSNKTVKDILVLLKQLFKYSKIDINICLPKCNKKGIKVLKKEEQKIIENYICNNLDCINFGIILSLYTGLRIGELCSLKWTNINLVDRTITITNTILRIKNFDDNSSKTKVIFNTPKSLKSLRIIPIPSQILKYLTELKNNVSSENNYFLTNSLKYMEPRSYYYHYKKIMKILNLQSYNFHVLRHTFATRCIELGFDYKTLSEILGHSDIRITLSLYVHPSNELKIMNMEKLKMY